MKVEHAVRVVRNFRRYRVGKKTTVWDQVGPLIPQDLIPKVTKTQDTAAYAVMEGKLYHSATRWVEVDKLHSTQDFLYFKSLMWVAKHFEKTPHPMVVLSNGVYSIWNGNHRVTAAILLGKKRIRVTLYKKRGR